MILADLPYPPSLNKYYRNVHGKTLISQEGRKYRKAVSDYFTINRAGATMRGRLGCHIVANPPDRRKRDLDNVLKAVLDAMEHAGIYVCDSQIDELTVIRSASEKGGRLSVKVYELEK